MDFSNFTYIHYCGPDCWGSYERTDEEVDALNAEFEHRIEEAFPGIDVRRTLDPHVTQVIGEEGEEAAEEEIHNAINHIGMRVLAGEPEPSET